MAPWKILGASVAGVSHRDSGASCQDAFEWGLVPEGPLILAVSDGAGSASRSEIGAQLAVREAVAFITRGVESGLAADEEMMRTAFESVNATLHSEATLGGLAVRDLACTLCVVVVAGERCIQGTIGDSGAVICLSPEEFITLHTPQKGTYVNETRFVTGSDWATDLQVSAHEKKPCGLLVSTDGLMDYLVRGGAPVPRLVSPLFKFVEEAEDNENGSANLTAFLSSANVTSKIYDDVTLLLCWCHRSETA